jgi:acylpyruvate hydrolase
MRLANFTLDSFSDIHCACICGGAGIDLTRAVEASAIAFPKRLSTVEDVIHTEGGLALLQQQIPDESAVPTGLLPFSFPLAKARFASPVLNPQKVIGIGFNYHDHSQEMDRPLPVEPLFFAMFANAINGPYDPIEKPSTTHMLDHEAELAVVIGKRGRHIPVERALEHVVGYTVFNDVSARNFQVSDSQWLRVKSFDSFAPMGPYLVTADELGDGSGLDITCRVNGEVRQSSNTRHLIFNVPFLVSYISRVMTLMPGDVISTGTPAGVGYARNPQVFLDVGDVVEVEIERIGTLRNPVVQAAE